MRNLKQVVVSVLLLSFIFSPSYLIPNLALAQKTLAPIKAGDPIPANAFVELAKLINPAVVNISTATMPKMRRGMGGGIGRDPFMDMLEQFYGMQLGPRQQQLRPQMALGTGFIIRDDGLIVTNNHVISGADKIQVQLSEKEKPYDAKLVGSDERTDIALIKISAPFKLPTVALGNSKDLEVGEWVAAFGNPLGQGHTMTKGILSAKGREIGEINKFPLLQTDTPINPGNSGGPLVNLRGQVVGVNNAIAASAQGIGFAIPIDDVKAILPALEKDGQIKKGYLGIGIDELSPQAAQYLGLKDQKGAIVASVDPKGGAAKGGVQPYDVITEFNGKKIESVQQLMDVIGDAAIGTTAKVKVIREGKTHNLEIKVGDRPQLQARAEKKIETRKEQFGQEAPEEMGFSLADLNDNLRKEFDIPKDMEKHPIVVKVEEGSKADQVGMMPGDIIIEVNRKTVTSTKEAMAQLKKGANTLRIARGNGVAIVVF